ncbi:MAG: ABC transporter ATP-binding protein [Clostridiales bacterium]|jgi:putative ABC transport system ATP-binding protein|nr:ABC transporter ATP-binding protein [Clostridiales bacterium]
MLIQLNEIKKSFKNGRNQEINVLNGINLSVDKGEMIALKGSSGAGKSTLLQILGCLDKPTDGTYELEGQDLNKKSAAQLSKIRNKKFGFVMQNFALIEEDSVLKNVGVPLLFGDTSYRKIDKLAYDQLCRFGIEKLADQRTSRLSGGEKQRVAIARALINQPEVILADEPTGALDTKNSAMIMSIFCQLNKLGKTIIIVTHENFVASQCHRIITISDGKLNIS